MSERLKDWVINLPHTYSVRETVVADVAACTTIVRNVDIAAVGETTTTEEELQGDIEDPNVVKNGGSVVVVNRDARVVALLNAFNGMDENRSIFFDVFIEPALPDVIQDAIALSFVIAVERYTTNQLDVFARDHDECKTALYKSDRAFITALQERDFEFHRTFWRMSRPVSEDIPVVMPSGYVLKEFDGNEETWDELCRVHNAAFTDYYDFRPLSVTGFREALTGGINDSSQWRILYRDDSIVGYCMPSKRFESGEFGYIGSIGVLREHRSQGLAKAMLIDAFNRDRERGLRGTILHGDSSNPTGAMKLYESLGMRQDREYVAYRKKITKH